LLSFASTQSQSISSGQRRVFLRRILVFLSLGGVLASACDAPAPDFANPKTASNVQDFEKKTDMNAYVVMDRAHKKVESARNVAGMPEATVARLANEALVARKGDEAAQAYGHSVSDVRVVSALRERLASYLDRLAELALATKMVPKVSPLSPECWTPAPMSSNEARSGREQLLNRAQLSLSSATVNFSITQAGKTPTAEAFNTALVSGASRAFFELRGIERPSIEQMEEVYKKGSLRSEFLAFGHCVFWTEGDFTNSLGPAT
jgi:hypothetical protein